MRLFRRKRLLGVGALFHFCFRHPLRRVENVVVVLQMAQERDSVVDVVHHYQVAPTVVAFYYVLILPRRCQCT